MTCSFPCAGLVFAQLPREALTTIKQVCTTAKEAMEALKLAKQAASLNMDVSLAPLLAKKVALEAAISEVRSKTKVIPQSLVIQCPQVGLINTLLESALSGALDGVTNLIFDIDRLQSLKLSVTAEILQLDEAMAFFDQIMECLDEVLNS